AVDVLAGLHGVNADLGVPVVGRADDDGVDVAAVEQLAVVLAHVGLLLADVPVVPGLLGVLPVDVADGQDIDEPCRAPRAPRRVAAGGEQAGAWPVVRGAGRVGQGPAGGRVKRE